MFTLSITSKNTSFLRYRMPSVRHDTAFVTAIGGRTWISSLCDSCVMYLHRIWLRKDVSNIASRTSSTHSCRILLSVVCGYPKSIISSISSYIITKLSLILSSSSSLKYSTSTCVSRCRNRIISAALELRFERASTACADGNYIQVQEGMDTTYDTDLNVGYACN
jgi:hypothetical protein